MSNTIESELISVAASFLKADVSSLNLDSGPGDIARWDSFAHVGLISEVEMKFDIAFDAEEMVMFETLRDICEAIRLRRGSGQ